MSVNPSTAGQPAPGQTTTVSPQVLGQGFKTVFYRCTQYSIAHCQIAGNPLSDANVPAAMKNRLVHICDSQQQAVTLLQNPSTKSLVIAKLICIFLESQVFKVGVFQGLDNQHDQLLDGIQTDNYEHMPVPNRTVLLSNVRDSFRRLVARSDFLPHLQTVIQTQGEAVWPTLQSLFGHKTTADWADLHQMMDEAITLCGRLFLHPARYIFTYFASGDVFQDSEMTNVSPAFATIPGQVMQENYFTVSFCVTPRVEMRMYNPAGYISTVTITKATVLCSAPAVTKAAAAPPPPPASPVPHDPRKLIGRRRYDGADSTEDDMSAGDGSERG